MDQQMVKAPAIATIKSATDEAVGNLRSARQEAVSRDEQRERELRTRRAVESLWLALGDRYSPTRARLDTFAIYQPSQRPVIDRLRELTNDPETLLSLVHVGTGLIFLGSVGTGKDHLMAAMLYLAAARLGIECQWISGQEFYGEFRDRMDSGDSEGSFLGKLARPQVLAISDPIPPVGSPSQWNVSQLYRLLDRRYRCLKSTWVSMNALSESDADERLSAPVFDRLRENAEIFRCFWPSYRERKA